MFKERDENCPYKTGVKATFAGGMKNLTTLLTVTISFALPSTNRGSKR